MPSLTRRQATGRDASKPNSGRFAGPAADEAPRAGHTLDQHIRAFDGPTQASETRTGHARRMARRTRLHGYALVAVALFALVIALAAANTAHVRASWLFGSSRVSLLWLVLAAAIIGWLLGLVTNAALHRRTRAPRPTSRPGR